MGLNLGICREDEKQAKKGVILDYLTSHLKVSDNFIAVHCAGGCPLYFCISFDFCCLILSPAAVRSSNCRGSCQYHTNYIGHLTAQQQNVAIADRKNWRKIRDKSPVRLKTQGVFANEEEEVGDGRLVKCVWESRTQHGTHCNFDGLLRCAAMVICNMVTYSFTRQVTIVSYSVIHSFITHVTASTQNLMTFGSFFVCRCACWKSLDCTQLQVTTYENVFGCI